jgi:hypothetical protein
MILEQPAYFGSHTRWWRIDGSIGKPRMDLHGTYYDHSLHPFLQHIYYDFPYFNASDGGPRCLGSSSHADITFEIILTDKKPVIPGRPFTAEMKELQFFHHSWPLEDLIWNVATLAIIR